MTRGRGEKIRAGKKMPIFEEIMVENVKFGERHTFTDPRIAK